MILEILLNFMIFRGGGGGGATPDQPDFVNTHRMWYGNALCGAWEALLPVPVRFEKRDHFRIHHFGLASLTGFDHILARGAPSKIEAGG